MNNKCEYCNNVFKTLKIMIHHQKTAKFCLIKQKKELNCEYCNNRSFTQNDFENHQNNCIVFLKSKIKELNDENKDIVYYQNETEFYKKQLASKDTI